MRSLAATVAAVALLALVAAAQAAPPPEPSCVFSYETEGDPYNTLYLYDVNHKSVRIDIVDTDTETVLHQIYAYRFGTEFYVYLDAYLGDIDATTEFVVYANNVKPSDGGSGKLLTECYA